MSQTYQQEYITRVFDKQVDHTVADLLLSVFLVKQQNPIYNALVEMRLKDNHTLAHVARALSMTVGYISSMDRQMAWRFTHFLQVTPEPWTVSHIKALYGVLSNEDVSEVISNSKYVRALLQAGVTRVEGLQMYSVSMLARVPGISKEAAKKIEAAMALHNTPMMPDAMCTLSQGERHFILNEALSSSLDYGEWCKQWGIPYMLPALWLEEFEARGFIFPAANPQLLDDMRLACKIRKEHSWPRILLIYSLRCMRVCTCMSLLRLQMCWSM